MSFSSVPELTIINERRNSKHWLLPFGLVTSLFFFWGFVHSLDPILIPHLRKSFQLNDLQSALIDSSVFIAYFIMALPAGFIMRRYGYRAGIIGGLMLFATGCFLFLPAADTHRYIFFLGALFVIASGLTFLETAANPYTTVLGPSSTATSRLNFAQSFNGLATMLAPVIGGQIILSGNELTATQFNNLSPQVLKQYLNQEAQSVKLPYLILGIIILFVTILFMVIKLPDIKEAKENKPGNPLHVFRHRHLSWAIVTQFFYVGAQVCVGSFFIRMAKTGAGMDERTAALYLGWGYGFAFMAGRFAGVFLMRFFQSEKLLRVYAILNIILSAVAMFMQGMVVIYALIGIAFFMSIMFPTIFSLGIKDLGKDTKLASSLIVMSIVGGALLPPLLGVISDATGNIQNGYIIPLICFIVVLLFAVKGHKIKSLPVEKY